jgi:REP element-mobilizing transposase RayT
MPFDPEKHHRRSIRIQGYDYSQAGAYFITVCIHKKECLLGSIENAQMVLNEYGQMVYDEWFRSSEIRNEIELFEGEFIIMPNHIHGIVWIVQNNENVEPNDNFVGVNSRSPLRKKWCFLKNDILPQIIFLPLWHEPYSSHYFSYY